LGLNWNTSKLGGNTLNKVSDLSVRVAGSFYQVGVNFVDENNVGKEEVGREEIP